MTVRVTTNPGIEDVAGDECRSLLERASIQVRSVAQERAGLQGVVMITLGDPGFGPASPDRIDGDSYSLDSVWEALRSARSVYHMVVHIGEIMWNGEPLDDLAARIASLPYDLMTNAAGFRASCSRLGDHPFKSPDVESAVGAALQQKYQTPVSLTAYEVNIRVDILGNRCLCGYQLTGKKGLDRRYPWVYHPRITLRTTVAYAMLRIAGYLDRPGRLLDPFCGSGTILLEAAAISGDASGPPGTMIVGSDRATAAADGCEANVRACGIRTISVSRHDARELNRIHEPESFDYIVTNPPFGIRLANDREMASLYRQFLGQAAVLLRPGGVLSLLVARRRGRFNRILQSFGAFTVEHVRIIEIGGVYPGLFVLRKSESVGGVTEPGDGGGQDQSAG